MVLADDERKLIERLWPDHRQLLVPFDASTQTEAAVSKEAKPIQLSFVKPMLYTLRITDNAYQAHFGLPEEPGQALKVTWIERDGRERTYTPKTLSAIGVAKVAASEGQDAGPPTVDRLQELFDRFIEELADQWPYAICTDAGYRDGARALKVFSERLARSNIHYWGEYHGGNERLEGAADYLLELLWRGELNPIRKKSARWQALREKLFKVTLVRTLGGDWVDLRSLAKLAATDESVSYVSPEDRESLPKDADSRKLPVVQHPRKLAVVLGGVKLVRNRPAVDPASTEPEVVLRAREVLTLLHGKRGMKLLDAKGPTIKGKRSSGDRLLAIGRSDVWNMDMNHPLAQEALQAPLPKEHKAAYLASLLYTRANRILHQVTDLDDVKFQQALADHLSEKRDG